MYQHEIKLQINKQIRKFGAVPNTSPVRYQVTSQRTSATFQIDNAKLYVPVATLSINNNIKFLENITQGFKRIISWNKYRSEITTQPKNISLNYLIDLTFRNINRLSVISFKNGNNNLTRGSFDKYYMQLVETKDFNELVDNKPFLINQYKTNKKRMKNLLKCQEMMTTQQEIY